MHGPGKYLREKIDIMPSDERTQKFMNHYDMNRVGERRGMRRLPMMFNYPTDASVVTESTCETEPVLIIEVPKSQLDRLAVLESHMYSQNPSRTLVNDMLDREAAEEEMREKYPAIKDAWEKYSMLLHLHKGYK